MSVQTSHARKEAHLKLVRFIISGLAATATNLLFAFILTEFFHLWYLLSVTIAFWAGFLISFFLQKFWTFRDHSKDKIRQQAFLFLVIIFAGVIINDALVYGFVEYIDLHYLTAQIIGSAFIAFVNFFVYQKLVFTGSMPAS